ncbi:MAG: type I-D CRISPR-associated protein Cas7/Csc2 [Leptolyngbya sp. SIO4C1]|nr:type I-D CRISPR-associated protein Cas7/Csc2 [Leptolyngbya sp. SIO4C1]
MTILDTLKPHFHDEFPRLASGKYIHFVMLRHSQSFPIFQTDGVLNTARTQAGLEDDTSISRLVMFKRKQTTPERLTGRELLRALELTTADAADKAKHCEYNGEGSCKKCPDCILYGFAIGDSGSERSKVYSDSAFSLSAYELSHKSFTFNAPYEGGTMSEGGTMRSAINEQDHVLPEVTFPTIETLRDATLEGFLYVLGNLLRTRRYGAQETRTGSVKNHLVGLVFADGELFSNLYLTQALHDVIKGEDKMTVEQLCDRAATVLSTLLPKEPIRTAQTLIGVEVKQLVTEVNEIYQDEEMLQSHLQALYQQTERYATTYGAFAKKGKKK